MRYATMVCVLLAVLSAATGCGGTKRVAAEDEYVVVTDFGHYDLRAAAKEIADSLAQWSEARHPYRRPLAYFHRVLNQTDQHINTRAVTDRMQVILTKERALRFTGAMEVREELVDQLTFQQGALVNPATAREIGRMTGADYFLYGYLTSITQRAGRKKSVYYNLTMKIIDIETAVVEWSGDAELQKIRTRGLFGL